MDIEMYDRYILCVYECGGLTKAANELGVSQPALSMSISNLEKKLGFEIFNRKSKPFSLTKEGEIYVDCIKKQNLLRQDCQRRIDDLKNNQNQNLVVGGPVIYVDSIITKAVCRLNKEFPGSCVTITNDQLPHLVEDTLAGKMDCFISTSDKLPKQLEKREIKKEHIYLCIPKDWTINDKLAAYQVHPGEKGECMDYKVLSGLPMISLLPQLPLQQEMDQFFDKQRVSFQSVIRTSQANTALRLATQGVGIAAVTEEVLANGQFDNELCFYSLPDDVSGREIFIAYDKDRYLSHICTRFIEIVLG